MTVYSLGERRPSLPSDGDFWIAPDANVIGDVRIGRKCSIWFSVTLRGDSEPIVLGAGSNVQESTVIHTDPGFPCSIGENVTIGHKAMLHGCTIRGNALVGMGATILNGAVIGTNCLIGAGTLVPEGKEIPDGSLVLGMPGRIVRQVEERHVEMIRAAAEHYQLRQQEYRAGLTLLDG
ncbi:MAG: gamma carbonic anhydrase family protein [Boseongicola sp.]|nr:gamma carbonic anhydrase family protein [Boseongicola sp.]